MAPGISISKVPATLACEPCTVGVIVVSCGTHPFKNDSKLVEMTSSAEST